MTRDAAVIFLSALDETKDKVRGFEVGAVDFITKPFQGDEVIARVNTHMTIQRLLRRSAARTARPPDRDGQIDPPTASRREPSARPGRRPSRGSGPAACSRDFDPAPAAPSSGPGDVVAYRFRIVRYLAKGGMGELYEAEDLELHERVALKTILSKIADDERSDPAVQARGAPGPTGDPPERLPDLRRVPPPAAARGRRRGTAPEVVFLAMELLHGETLADRLRREGRLSTADALALARQMAAGLRRRASGRGRAPRLQEPQRHAGEAARARSRRCAS